MAHTGMSLKEFKRRAKSHLTLQTSEEDVVIDIYEKAESCKTKKRQPTGIVHNEIFAKHECEWDSNHPECPARYTSIMSRLHELNLVGRCVEIDSAAIEQEDITDIHDLNHIIALKNVCEENNMFASEDFSSDYDSVYVNKHTYKSAMFAAGSSINLVKAILNKEIQNGLAIVRPPGHHASRDEFCGFCFLNNAALAANYALKKFNLKKILIVDWDVHHGQGTQEMFYNDPRVLYFSIHRYENGMFWPYLRESHYDFIGAESGIGFNINVPLNDTECGDQDYFYIFNNILLPVAYEYQPELVLISAGFDAAVGCPEGRMMVTPGCYAHLTNLLMGLAEGKIALILEGGYFLPSLAESAALCLGALLGDVPPAPVTYETEVEPKAAVRDIALNLIYTLRPYWKCFCYFENAPNESEIEDNASLYHVVELFYTRGQELEPPFQTRDYPVKNSDEENDFYSTIMDTLKIDTESYSSKMRPMVGYCYDESMLLHKSPQGTSYEKPERLTIARDILNDFGLLERMVKIEAGEATESEILMAHSMAYYEKLKSLGDKTESELFQSFRWTTVYTCKDSLKSATMAVGSAIKLVDMIVDGLLTSGVGLIRPPGHHAEKTDAGGFCLFNNVAVAAQHAILNRNLQRVMILDFDIHHGNGTQKAFIDNPNILYMSLHRYDQATFYPNSTSGDFSEIGRDDGEGYNVNVAWNDNRMSDVDYFGAFFRIVLPIAYEFKPELLLISGGFDAAVGDPLGGYNVTPEAYGHFIQLLKPVCGGKIILLLEGGYNCHSIGYCLAMCCKALLGDPLPMLSSLGRPSDGAIQSIENTVKVHKSKWNNLQMHILYLHQ